MSADELHAFERSEAQHGPAATFATTEHFNLQTARGLTVSESNGRASIYLAALLAYVGVVTFLRVSPELESCLDIAAEQAHVPNRGVSPPAP